MLVGDFFSCKSPKETRGPNLILRVILQWLVFRGKPNGLFPLTDGMLKPNALCQTALSSYWSVKTPSKNPCPGWRHYRVGYRYTVYIEESCWFSYFKEIFYINYFEPADWLTYENFVSSLEVLVIDSDASAQRDLTGGLDSRSVSVSLFCFIIHNTISILSALLITFIIYPSLSLHHDDFERSIQVSYVFVCVML